MYQRYIVENIEGKAVVRGGDWKAGSGISGPLRLWDSNAFLVVGVDMDTMPEKWRVKEGKDLTFDMTTDGSAFIATPHYSSEDETKRIASREILYQYMGQTDSFAESEAVAE